ncbi:hypothetical protein EDD11_009808 [Mortierella claussenii]|nr:hypothetical protein EDD11_009808 [Mortierella claussenii]
MYRIKPQVLNTQRSRNPTLLVSSTVGVVIAGVLSTKTAYCHNDTGIQAQADHLKEHVQEFTDQVLEMADSPTTSSPPTPSSSSSSSSTGRHGHSSPYFSSMGHRTGGPQGQYGGRMERFRGAYVEEPLIPALIYISVAGLAGSIIARKSNFVFRFLSPVALALGASAYCIPKTTNNVIHGLRTYDYREMSREWQHKYWHAKKSIVDTTHGLTAAAGSAAGTVTQGVQEAAHDISDKTHELTEKTSQVLKDVKVKTEDVAQDVKSKSKEVAKEVKHKTQDVAGEVKHKTQDIAGEVKHKAQDMAKEAKHKTQDMGAQVENAKNKVQDHAEDKADQAKAWWNAEKKNLNKSTDEWKRSAQHSGEQARDWAQNKGEDARDWVQDKTQQASRAAHRQQPQDFDKDDLERGWDRFRSKARQGWENTRDEAQDAWDRGSRDIPRDIEHRGREFRRNAESMKEQAQDWTRDRSREARGRFDDWKDHTEDWAQDRRRDARKWGREAEDQFNRTRSEFKRRGEEARDASEDRFKDAGRDLRHKAEDFKDEGHRQYRRFGRDFDDARSRSHSGERAAAGAGTGWGFSEGRRPYDDREDYEGNGRRSVTEAAREGKHWWQHKSAADPYEPYDNYNNSQQRPSSSSAQWWKAGSEAQDQAKDQFDHAKRHAEHGVGRFKDSLEEKAQSGRSWVADKSNDLKNRFEDGKQRFENDMREKFAHDGPNSGAHYRGREQGREFRDYDDHHHGSLYSNDSWFHYGHGENNRSSGRGRERGM